jgi:hypothetical protein
MASPDQAAKPCDGKAHTAPVSGEDCFYMNSFVRSDHCGKIAARYEELAKLAPFRESAISIGHTQRGTPAWQKKLG